MGSSQICHCSVGCAPNKQQLLACYLPAELSFHYPFLSLLLFRSSLPPSHPFLCRFTTLTSCTTLPLTQGKKSTLPAAFTAALCNSPQGTTVQGREKGARRRAPQAVWPYCETAASVLHSSWPCSLPCTLPVSPSCCSPFPASCVVSKYTAPLLSLHHCFHTHITLQSLL